MTADGNGVNMTREPFRRITSVLAACIFLAAAFASASMGGALTEDQKATLQSRLDTVNDPGFETLRSALEAHDGFLALLPGDDGILHAVFGGSVPAPLAPWPVPTGMQLRLHGGAEVERMAYHLPDVELEDLMQPATTGLPPNPADFNGVRPGSLLLTSFTGFSGTFICTLAFIMQDADTGRYYASTAGHCLLPAAGTATHGPGANWDPAWTSTAVCVNTCVFGGQLSLLNGDIRPLGAVKYARQVSNTPILPGDVGNDYGLVEIYPYLYPDIQPRMAMWDGPVGQFSGEGTGSVLLHYGNGIDGGSFAASKGRAGVSVNDGHPWTWQGIAEINGGDSGSPVSHADVVLDGNVLRGEDALGVLTHGIGLFGVGVPGLALGTPIDRGIYMADVDAGLDVALVHAGDDINLPPAASFSASCTGLACTFNGTGSSDFDGSVASYEWDFGDGNTGTGATPGHTFAASGAYTVTLTVRDNDGTISDPATQSAAVTNLAPAASFTHSCTDLACTFDGTGSSDTDGTIASYAWTFGDGNSGTGATPSHTYGAGGTYTVTLTVTDNAGGTDALSTSVTVTEPSSGNGKKPPGPPGQNR